MHCMYVVPVESRKVDLHMVKSHYVGVSGSFGRAAINC